MIGCMDYSESSSISVIIDQRWKHVNGLVVGTLVVDRISLFVDVRVMVVVCSSGIWLVLVWIYGSYY